MFGKFCTLALVTRLASALVLQIPENPTSGGEVTIKWTNEPNDPKTWTFVLFDRNSNNKYVLADVVNPSAGSQVCAFPNVTVGDYYRFVIGVSTSSNTASLTIASGSSIIVASSTSTESLSTPVVPISTGTSTSTGPLSTNVSVSSTGASPSSGTGTAALTTFTTRLSKGAIAGAVIGSMVGLALIIFSLVLFIKRENAAASLWREPFSLRR